MGRRDRSGSVNDTGNSAAGAGWPAALTPAPQRVATFKNGAAHLTNSNFMRARATSGELLIPRPDLPSYIHGETRLQ